MRKKVFSITGIRSEYDLQYSVSKTLNENQNIDFAFIVFGAHLSKFHGYTINEIVKDNFRIVKKIKTKSGDDNFSEKTLTVSILVHGLTKLFLLDKPDMVIVCGDREEVIAMSIVATYFNIPVCHLFGGDKTFPDKIGDIDEPIRNATSKLAHLHFVIHNDHALRLIKMGEEKFRVFNMGSPALDKYLNYSRNSFRLVENWFKRKINSGKYAVLIYHALPNDLENSLMEFNNILDVLSNKGITTFVSYPNDDPGHSKLIDIINQFTFKNEKFIPYKNLAREVFIPLLMNCHFLIGNSSMGILECPFLEKAAINVGKRQKGRLNAGNVLFVKGTKVSIKIAIRKIENDKVFSVALKRSKFFYGDGMSGKKIGTQIANTVIDNKLLAKQITY